MERRLTSYLTDPTAWRLFIKSALGAFSILALAYFNFSLLSILFFIFVFVLIYFFESPEVKSVKISFWLLTLLTAVSFYLINFAAPINFLVVLLWAILFLFLLLIVNFFFKDRFFSYGIFNTAVFLSFSFLFFYLARPDNFFLQLLLMFVVITFLFHEALSFYGIPHPKKIFASSVAAGFLGSELTALIIFLPLGFINAAAFLTLFFLLLRDVLAEHFQGHLNFDFVFRELVFFFVLTIFIFATSIWKF